MSYPVNFNDTVVYDGVDLYLPKDCSLTVFEDSRLYLYGEVYYNGAPLGTGGTGGGTQVFVGPTQPVDPNTILWFDTSTGYGELKALVGGSWKLVEDPIDSTVQDEVYVGATEPVASNYELWIDTVTAAPPMDAAYVSPGNALGIVKFGDVKNVGNTVSIPVASVDTVITETLNITLHSGRYYKVVFSYRTYDSATNSTYYQISLYDNGVKYPGSSSVYGYFTSTVANGNKAEWIISGDGAVHNFVIQAQATAAGQFYANDAPESRFYVEDMGPSNSPALPIPATPPAWTPITLTNGFTHRSTGYQPAVRQVGDVVECRGLMDCPVIGGTTIFTTLPAAFWPVKTVAFALVLGASPNTFLVRNTGTIELALANGSAQYAGLDVIKFSVTL